MACNACYTAWAHAATAQAWQHPTLKPPGLFIYALAHWQTGYLGWHSTHILRKKRAAVCEDEQYCVRDSTDRSHWARKLLQRPAWLTSFDLLFDLMRLPCQMLCFERAVPTIMHSADCRRTLQSILHTVPTKPKLIGKGEKLSINAMINTTGENTC